MSNNNIFIEKLRSSGLRPTRQRIKICKLLFDRKSTFHFTINDLSNSLKKKTNIKISLATIYNTIHSFKEKGYINFKNVSWTRKKTFQELDDILAQLESADLDIDKMIKLYERGMVLTNACKVKINEAEQKIKIINEADDSIKG